VEGVVRGARIAWTTWRASRVGAAAITEYQRRRLAALVRHARQSSPYYRRLYDGLPVHVADPRLLPAVREPDLMGHFDEWVTDFEVTLEALRRDFLADLSLVGSRYLGRYHASRRPVQRASPPSSCTTRTRGRSPTSCSASAVGRV
jgi:hypothetical protein